MADDKRFIDYNLSKINMLIIRLLTIQTNEFDSVTRSIKQAHAINSSKAKANARKSFRGFKGKSCTFCVAVLLLDSEAAHYEG